MKHLKSYKIFESISNADLELDVKDIFLDLQDAGYDIDIDMRPQGVDMFSVGVSNDKLFDWSDVKEEFLRSKEYITDNGFILDKVVLNYYQFGAYNDVARVISRMKTEKFVGSNYPYFLHLVDELKNKDGKIYELAFIYTTK